MGVYTLSFCNLFPIFLNTSLVFFFWFLRLTISWVSPLVAILLLEGLLNLVGLLDESIEQIDVVQVGVQVLLANLQLVKQIGSEIILGHFWELEILFHHGVSIDFNLVQGLCRHVVLLRKLFFLADCLIKVSLRESLAEFGEGIFQILLLSGECLGLLLGLFLTERLILFVIVRNSIDILDLDA